MSQTHLERIADLLPDEQRESWLRISSRFTNANKDTEDELWLLAELIAMIGIANREQGGGDTPAPSFPAASLSGIERGVAEKHRQIAATLERLSKSLSANRPLATSKQSPVTLVLLVLVVILQIVQLIGESRLIKFSSWLVEGLNP